MTTDTPLSKPVCLITGGSSGIGLATAMRFAREGYRVGICGRNEERLSSAAESMAQITDVWFHLCDVGDVGQARGLVQAAQENLGRVDILVNNVGFAPLAASAEMPLDDVRRAIDVNMIAGLATAQAAWPIMKEQGRGVLVNVSSLSAIDPFPGMGVYGACKSWVESLTLALAKEGQPLGIRAFAVRPGAVETPLLRRLFPDFPSDQCLTPAQVAGLIFQICGDDFAAASGQVFEVTK